MVQYVLSFTNIALYFIFMKLANDMKLSIKKLVNQMSTLNNKQIMEFITELVSHLSRVMSGSGCNENATRA